MEPYFVIQKNIGETPLETLERGRTLHAISKNIPLAYAGRLDPMASGALLILVGDECKNQTKYHAFDKEYIVELLLGLDSDSGDVLGLIQECRPDTVTRKMIEPSLQSVLGSIELPYPHFSSKTVLGKPLHTWTLENRLDEIEIPTKKSRIYKIKLHEQRTISKKDLLTTVYKKIESIPKVTDPRKALGADFRRDDVRATWETISRSKTEMYQIVRFSCIASSGTYMRSLCSHIASKVGTCGLALSIHRTTIGSYVPLTRTLGFWRKRFTS